MSESMETVTAILALSATIWLALGLGLAQLLRNQPARAHGILVAALIGTLITPVLYFGIQRANWGLLPSSEEVAQSSEVIQHGQPPGFFEPEPIRAVPLQIPRLEPVGELPKELNSPDPVTRFPEVIDRAEPVVRAISDSIVAQNSQSQVPSKFSLKAKM